MKKAQMVDAILKTYNKEMVQKYDKWLKRQPASTIKEIYNARVGKDAKGELTWQ